MMALPEVEPKIYEKVEDRLSNNCRKIIILLSHSQLNHASKLTQKALDFKGVYHADQQYKKMIA